MAVLVANVLTKVPTMMRAEPIHTVGLRPYFIDTQLPKKDANRPGK